jgi:SAM-dependent methyltransferase
MASTSPGRAHFEVMETQGDRWLLSGWIFHPDVATSSIATMVDGQQIGTWAPIYREAVAAAFPWTPHAGASGFRFEVPRDGQRKRVRIEARSGDRVLTDLRTTLSLEFEDMPVPPPELMQRVSGSPDPRFFNADAVRSYTEFVEALARHGDSGSISRMLDWGCGCGRVTRCFLRAHPRIEVYGCDIDTEAISWCTKNLPQGRFQAVQPEPPTGYLADTFQLVVGYSVFSHLDADMQRAWLGEVQRILAPGGLFLVSVNGRFVARFAYPQSPPRWRKWIGQKNPLDRLESQGFLDGGEDVALRGVAPEGYYRGVYQTPNWTRRAFSPYLEVLDILEAGMQNYQDLVILRKR